MTDFANNDKAAQATERAMADWQRRLASRGEPRPNTATYNAAFEAFYAEFKSAIQGQTP